MLANQAALSLGYIALKRIRALEEPAAKLPSNSLLRHLSHCKVLAACVDQVGPDEIIQYEINQDTALEEPFVQQESSSIRVLDDADCFRMSGVSSTDDVSEARGSRSARQRNNKFNAALHVIEEDEEHFRHVEDSPPRQLSVTNLTDRDMEEADFSMDELYDQLDSDEDGWETASDQSDDLETNCENEPPLSQCISASNRRADGLNTDAQRQQNSPPSQSTSGSPPIDIVPRTQVDSKYDQYRSQVDPVGDDLSRVWIEQIEDVLVHEIRCLSLASSAGKMRMESFARQQVSLYA
jgi:hypothetical protein